MRNPRKDFCPECEQDRIEPQELPRREFMRVVGERTVVAAGVAGLLASPATADEAAQPTGRQAKPAEGLIRELYTSLTPEQQQELVLPWDHGAENGSGLPTRLGMYNRPIGGKLIGEKYSAAQQELIERILRAICADEEGYHQISRGGSFDGSRSLQGCGAVIFGDPTADKFSWVFSGHHLTVRCDGDHQDGVAFGGPMYYGHSPNGYNEKNVFYYQTRRVLSVYDALDGKQREQAVVTGNPGEGEPSVRFRAAGQAKPGIVYAELSEDQRGLVEKVMRDVLSPYRKEDVDEVMEIVQANGGLERIHLAFYRDERMQDSERWHFWRLEGPGFVWNYRVLPHVHTYVNIARRA